MRDVHAPLPVVPADRPIKVFSEVSLVNEFLTSKGAYSSKQFAFVFYPFSP